MTRRYPSEAVIAARAAQAAFRRAGAALSGVRSPTERRARVGAFLAARDALLAVPAALRAELDAEAEAERQANKYSGMNPAGAERLRRWSRG